MQGPLRRLPWQAPVWHAGEEGSEFVPGILRKHVDFWGGVILQDQPLRENLVSYLREEVSINELLLASHRGASVGSPYKLDRFPGAVFQNRIPPAHAEIVDVEMRFLISQGCVV